VLQTFWSLRRGHTQGHRGMPTQSPIVTRACITHLESGFTVLRPSIIFSEFSLPFLVKMNRSGQRWPQ
jgi:hypothetical protein